MALEINICSLHDTVQVIEINPDREPRVSYQLEPASQRGKLQRISPAGTPTLIRCTLYIQTGQRLIFTIQPGHRLIAESGPSEDRIAVKHPDGSHKKLTLCPDAMYTTKNGGI